MEPSEDYSNVDPTLLTYDGIEYSHLDEVLAKKIEYLKESLNLYNVHIPNWEISTIAGLNSISVLERRQEEQEEQKLLATDYSIYIEKLNNIGFSFENIKIPFLPINIKLDVLAPTVIQAGDDMMKLAVKAFGSTRADDIPNFAVLGSLKPMIQHLVGLGIPVEYDIPFEKRSEGGLILTHPSITFEDITTLMPIFHSLLFCASIYNGDGSVGISLRKGFTLGLFPPTTNGKKIFVRHMNQQIMTITDAIWKRGTSLDAMNDPNWKKWKSANNFDPLSQSKGSSVRDLVRFCWNKHKVTLRVVDVESAALAFGLAQIGLCRIEALNLGPTGGVTVFGRQEHGIEALNLEPSIIMKSHLTFPYIHRQLNFRICNIPTESEDFLLAWLDKQIAETAILGIENGDPPGTVLMTPEFSILTQTGLMKSLGEEIRNIALSIAERCSACEGSCTNMIFSTKGLNQGVDNCNTVLFLNTLITIYVGGVLLKGGMEIDQCTICSNLDRTIKSLNRLNLSECRGLGSFLASWYILRTGEDAPHIDYGPVLGIQMDGKVHGLRYAVQPGTKGSALVSLRGHLYEGRHACACLVYEPSYLPSDIILEAAKYTRITEQPPDVNLIQLLLVRSLTKFIAIDTVLIYPDGERSMQIHLGEIDEFKKNIHKCTKISEDLYATPLEVSQCTDGNSAINLDETYKKGLKYALHTYNSEEIQSWICGLFPKDIVCFQGRRSLSHSLALLKEGDILIQGWSEKYNAIAK